MGPWEVGRFRGSTATRQPGGLRPTSLVQDEPFSASPLTFTSDLPGEGVRREAPTGWDPVTCLASGAEQRLHGAQPPRHRVRARCPGASGRATSAAARATRARRGSWTASVPPQRERHFCCGTTWRSPKPCSPDPLALAPNRWGWQHVPGRSLKSTHDKNSPPRRLTRCSCGRERRGPPGPHWPAGWGWREWNCGHNPRGEPAPGRGPAPTVHPPVKDR